MLLGLVHGIWAVSGKLCLVQPVIPEVMEPPLLCPVGIAALCSSPLCPPGSGIFETQDKFNLSKQLLPPLPTQNLAAVAFPSYKFQLSSVY